MGWHVGRGRRVPVLLTELGKRRWSPSPVSHLLSGRGGRAKWRCPRGQWFMEIWSSEVCVSLQREMEIASACLWNLIPWEWMRLLKGPKLCHPKSAFWGIDFKLLIKKNTAQQAPWTPNSSLRDSAEKASGSFGPAGWRWESCPVPWGGCRGSPSIGGPPVHIRHQQ